MNCPISVVDVGRTRVAQAHNSSIWRGDSRPVPPFRSNRTSASMPPSWNSLIQMRMVESSTKRTLATSSKLIPRSSSRMAFARRETRFSSSPSLVIATRSARSAALRKLRLVFTRRLESIPLIRSNDFRKKGAEEPIHVVSAFAARQRMVLGQVKVGDKSNEIVAIPALLDLLAIEGAVVTIDAMGCQRDIAQKIIDKKADYILALKGNQGTLRDDVEMFAREQKAVAF